MAFRQLKNPGKDNSQRTSPSSQFAPWHEVPSSQIVSIEHPLIVQNVSKIAGTLGGEAKMTQLVKPESIKSKGSLYLRPEDRAAKPIMSSNLTAGGILIRVCMPKRTSRRRKRGSQGPFMHFHDDGVEENKELHLSTQKIADSRDVQQLLGSLRDNQECYSVEAVGKVVQTHRFRSMSDFVWSTTKSPFMQKVREHIIPLQVESLKAFTFDPSKGQTIGTDIPPPPSFTHLPVPFNYQYQQNPNLKHVLDNEGNLNMVNLSANRRLNHIILQYNAAEVPVSAPLGAQAVESMDKAARDLIAAVRPLLDERPVWTRRALRHRLKTEAWTNVGKWVFPCVGYQFSSGPWRDTVIRFGHDPRTDPQSRFYQTIQFQLDNRIATLKYKKTDQTLRNWGGSRKTTQTDQDYYFDGRSLARDGKIWQVCDITDPLLLPIINTTLVRKTCEPRNDGWYHNGTWAKLRSIMRDKVARLLKGQDVPDDEEYARILAFPDILTTKNRHLTVLPRNQFKTVAMDVSVTLRAHVSKTGFESYDVDSEVEMGSAKAFGGIQSNRNTLSDFQSVEIDDAEIERRKELDEEEDGEDEPRLSDAAEDSDGYYEYDRDNGDDPADAEDGIDVDDDLEDVSIGQ